MTGALHCFGFEQAGYKRNYKESPPAADLRDGPTFPRGAGATGAALTSVLALREDAE